MADLPQHHGQNGARIYHGLIRKKKMNWHKSQYRIVALLEATKRHIESQSRDWSRNIQEQNNNNPNQQDSDADKIVGMDSFFSKLKHHSQALSA